MWFGASPEEPRSSAIGLLLSSFHLPARGGGRRRSRRVGACCWSNRGRTPRLLLPFRGEGRGEGRGRTPPPLPFRGEGRGEGRGRTSPPLPFRGEGWGEGRGRTSPPLPFRGEGWGEGRGRTSLRDQRVHLLGRQVVVIAPVEPHHRRVLARAKALDFFVAEH